MIRPLSTNVQARNGTVTPSRLTTVVVEAHSGLSMHERPDPWLASLISRAMNDLTYSDGELTRSTWNVFDSLVWIARRAFEAGRQSAKMEVLTVTEVAEILGVDRTTVWRRAQARGVGWHVGRDVLFWTEDLARLR